MEFDPIITAAGAVLVAALTKLVDWLIAKKRRKIDEKGTEYEKLQAARQELGAAEVEFRIAMMNRLKQAEESEEVWRKRATLCEEKLVEDKKEMKKLRTEIDRLWKKLKPYDQEDTQ